jgi:phosphohistidine phosphatase
MAREWGLDPAALQIHEGLYMAYESEIREIVGLAPASEARLAIFGHNPSFTLFANEFLDDPLDNLPTAGVVVVTLESDSWSDLQAGNVRHCYVDFPKRKG